MEVESQSRLRRSSTSPMTSREEVNFILSPKHTNRWRTTVYLKVLGNHLISWLSSYHLSLWLSPHCVFFHWFLYIMCLCACDSVSPVKVLTIPAAVEFGLMSTTTNKATAMAYSGVNQARGTVFEITAGRVDVGASISFLSQYPGEAEFLMPPLCCLEVCHSLHFFWST